MDGLPVGLVNGIGVVTVVVIVGWMIATGRLVTRREADAMNATITAQRSQLDEQGRQLTLVLNEAMPTTNAVLKALHRAAEDTR